MKLPSYEILTNENCNLRCPYCFEGLDKGTRVNDADTCRAFLRALFKRDYGSAPLYPKNIPPEINLMGGESFLHIPLMNAIFDEALRCGERYGLEKAPSLLVITNGTLLHTEEAQAFLKKYAQYLYLSISVDGDKLTHDTFRKDAQGNGSYDLVMNNVAIAREILDVNRCNAKATFTKATIQNYSQGVISLLEAGFRHINANTVFEAQWDDRDTDILYPQIVEVVDYLLVHGLYKTVKIRHLTDDGTDLKVRTRNFCGCINATDCLGFDGLIYPCHRMATSRHARPIGYLDAKGIMHTTDQHFKEEILAQWRFWPEKCRICGLGSRCSSCCSAIYDFQRDHPELPQCAYHEHYSQCGFTIAMQMGRLYYRQRLLELDEKKGV